MSQMNLNDSGYSSPVVKGSSEEKVSFYVKLGNKETRETVIARKEDTLADALSQICSKKKMKNMLIWGITRGSDTGLKCINPFLLPCEFIEPKTEVEMQDAGNWLVCEYDMDLENTKPYSKLQGSIFFVSISGRRKKQAITKVHYKDLRYCDVCVFASAGQNFHDAFTTDSRFINVDNFTLREKVSGAGQGAKIGMNTKPADVGETVLEVNVQRAVQSRDTMSLKKSNCAGESSTSDVDTAKRSDTQGKKQTKRSWDELSNKLCGEHAMYIESKEDLTDQEVFSERQECLRARAWCTLLGPNERARGTKNLRTSLEKLANVEFANSRVTSRPVQFTKTLCRMYNSIGQLKCGSIRATCWLVSSDVIATNHHVVRDIEIARNSSTPYDHSEVYIDFDYESSEKTSSKEYKLKPFSYKGNITNSRLDYAFLFLEECVESKVALGDFVASDVPERGLVCIVGHPGDEQKQDEMCPILPLHDNGRYLELQRRYAENEVDCINNQSSCALACIGRKCVHSYQVQLQQLCGEADAMTYDVGSMFEGSSGAPVFDLKCNIIGLHTAGLRLKETSIIEYAVTFRAIIEDLFKAGHSKFVKSQFPYYYQQDMETEDSQSQ